MLFVSCGGVQMQLDDVEPRRTADKPGPVGEDGAPDDDKPTLVDADGSMVWMTDGLLDRGGDKPAFVGADGHMVWARGGVVGRRRGLPSKIWPNGDMEWWVDGQLVRRRHAPLPTDNEHKV